ncbi:hypothetical protein ACI48D_05015 [Massilia sp. LXY-6]
MKLRIKSLLCILFLPVLAVSAGTSLQSAGSGPLDYVFKRGLVRPQP